VVNQDRDEQILAHSAFPQKLSKLVRGFRVPSNNLAKHALAHRGTWLYGKICDLDRPVMTGCEYVITEFARIIENADIGSPFDLHGGDILDWRNGFASSWPPID
jgi:hypothetical protein